MTERPPMQWFSGQLDDAFSYAHAVHGAQGRKSGAPAYIGHLLGVAALVVDDGGSEAEVIAALLHDAVEDAGGAFRLADIEHRYGSEVAYIVDVCSDTKTDPKPPWRERKTAYLDRLAASMPHIGIVRVTAADKIWNLSATLSDLHAFGSGAWSQFTMGRESQLWFHRSVLATLDAAAPGSLLVARLGRLLDEVAALTD